MDKTPIKLYTPSRPKPLAPRSHRFLQLNLPHNLFHIQPKGHPTSHPNHLHASLRTNQAYNPHEPRHHSPPVSLTEGPHRNLHIYLLLRQRHSLHGCRLDSHPLNQVCSLQSNRSVSLVISHQYIHPNSLLRNQVDNLLPNQHSTQLPQSRPSMVKRLIRPQILRPLDQPVSHRGHHLSSHFIDQLQNPLGSLSVSQPVSLLEVPIRNQLGAQLKLQAVNSR